MHVIHASQRTKATLPPTYEWAITTSALRMVETILSRQHHAPGAQDSSSDITATAVKSQASKACGLFAAREAGNFAHLRHPCKREVALLKKLSGGASATTSEGID